jgi:putative FmdB family regulatory protein
MPIYEYQCESCAHTLDALQKMSDDPLTECPECHQATLKKKISAPRFRLGGSGWYETDFKSGNKRNIAEKKESSSSSSESSGKSSDGATSAANSSGASGSSSGTSNSSGTSSSGTSSSSKSSGTSSSSSTSS